MSYSLSYRHPPPIRMRYYGAIYICFACLTDWWRRWWWLRDKLNVLISSQNDGSQVSGGEIVVVCRQVNRSEDSIHERHADTDGCWERSERHDNDLSTWLIHQLSAVPRVADAQIAVDGYSDHYQRRKRDIWRNQELIYLQQQRQAQPDDRQYTK